MRKKIIFLTRVLDKNDPVGGFTIEWVRTLSRFSSVTVICQELGITDFDQNVNVYSLGKEKIRSKILYLIRFYFYFLKEIFKSDGVFGHMCPVYFVLAWPAVILNKKMILWYCHKKSSFLLRMAVFLADKVYSIGFPYECRKLQIVNHGVDTAFFVPGESVSGIKLLYLGRISRIKNIEPVIDSAIELKKRGIDFSLEICGGTRTEDDISYEKELKNRALEISQQIIFTSAIPHHRTREIYQKSTIFIDMMSYGPNKTMIEAASCGLPVITAGNWLNFEKNIAERLVCEPLAVSIAQQIIRLQKEDREKIARNIRKHTVKNYDIIKLMSLIAGEFNEN